MNKQYVDKDALITFIMRNEMSLDTIEDKIHVINNVIDKLPTITITIEN